MRLRRFVVLYEPEAACRARLIEQGHAPDVAAEVAFYLAQATDLVPLMQPIAEAFSPAGVEASFHALDDHDAYLPLLQRADPAQTLLWCVTDGFFFYRGSFVGALGALLGVPTFGSGPEVLHLAQDKFRCTALARAIGVRAPETMLARDGEALSPAAFPHGVPLFVKPNRLGAKIGIATTSRCADLATALDLSRRIHERYGDDAVVQAYVEGEDVRVSCMDLGRGEPPLGVYRIELTDGGLRRPFPTLDDSLAMTSLRAPGTAGSREKPMRLDMADLAIEAASDPRRAAQLATIRDATRRLVRLLGLRDYFSLDFRLGADGTVYFLELEVCPAVTIYDFLTYLQKAYGLGLPAALAEAAVAAHARRLASLRLLPGR